MNAIDIAKRVGVLIPPISLEKEEPVEPYIYQHKKKQLFVELLSKEYMDSLNPDEKKIISSFIWYGGIGRDCLLAVQRKHWGEFKARSTEVLISAIRKGGWDEKEVLWDMYPIGYNPNRSNSCLS